MEVMTYSEVSDAVRKMQEEASAETTLAFVCAKTNFKDAFVETDRRLGSKILARFPRWEKGLSDEQRERMTMLSHLDQTVRDFANHLSEAIPEVREAISAEGESGIFYLELRRFVAMKGRMSFFSTGGAGAALALSLRRETRKYFHEARGRAAKYALEAAGDVSEDKIEEIVRRVWHEHHDDLCGVLLRPLEFALPGGENTVTLVGTARAT